MRSFLRRRHDHDAHVVADAASTDDAHSGSPLLGTEGTDSPRKPEKGGIEKNCMDSDKVVNWLLEAPENEVLTALRAFCASKSYLIERALQDVRRESLRQSPALGNDEDHEMFPAGSRRSPALGNDEDDEMFPAGSRMSQREAQLLQSSSSQPARHPKASVSSMSRPVQAEDEEIELRDPFRPPRVPLENVITPILERASSDSAPSEPVLKFAASMFFCTESDQEVEVTVLRIGDCSARSEVEYATCDRSAKAGVNYERSAGRLIFESGEIYKHIRVNLFADDAWAPLQEFAIELLEQGAVNVCLEFGCSVLVKVIDNDFFPSAKYQDMVKEGGAPMWDYFKLNFRQPAVMTATVKQVMVEQSRNIIFVVGLFAQVIMVDVVLKSNDMDSDTKFTYVCCIVLWQVLSHAWTHFWDYRTTTWRTAGMSRMMLQSALLRTYLHHDEKDRHLLRRGDLEMVINVMVPDLVQSGYMNMIQLVSKVGKLGMLLVFHLASPVVFHEDFKPTGLVASVVFPLVLGFFFFTRRRIMERLRDEEQRHNSALFEHVEQSGEFYHLVAGFGCQNLFVSKFESLIRLYNAAVIERLQVSTNNVYFAKWWGTAAVGFYTAFGGWQVLNEKLPLGMFLANTAALRTMGDIWDGIYADLLDMDSAVPALRHIMKLMNLTTDADKRMNFQRACTSTTLRHVEDNVPGAGLHLSGIQKTPDSVPFQIKSSDNSRLELPQGQMIAVIGVGGSGKGGLLKILGGVKYPEGSRMNHFFIPSHLRLVHIGASPLLFRGSLWDNLTFGSESTPSDVQDEPRRGSMLRPTDISSERVTEICLRLGLSPRLVELLEPGARSSGENNWMEILSAHELQVLSLARGFICNPNVLVLHTPTVSLDETVANRCFGMMREFVDQKGVAEDASLAPLRRPRTCIFSASRPQGIEASDRVVLAERGSFREVSKDEAYDAVGPTNVASLESLGCGATDVPIDVCGSMPVQMQGTRIF